MRYTLEIAHFDKISGISYVIINTDLGKFIGQSQLHEEDKDIQSDFEGCRYAEMRALIKYYKEKIKIYKIKVDILKEMVDNIEKINNYEKNSPEARFIRKQYFIKQNILNKQKEQIKILENGLYNQMKNYRQKHEDFMKKINKKEQEPTEE